MDLPTLLASIGIGGVVSFVIGAATGSWRARGVLDELKNTADAAKKRADDAYALAEKYRNESRSETSEVEGRLAEFVQEENTQWQRLNRELGQIQGQIQTRPRR